MIFLFVCFSDFVSRDFLARMVFKGVSSPAISLINSRQTGPSLSWACTRIYIFLYIGSVECILLSNPVYIMIWCGECEPILFSFRAARVSAIKIIYILEYTRRRNYFFFLLHLNLSNYTPSRRSMAKSMMKTINCEK